MMAFKDEMLDGLKELKVQIALRFERRSDGVVDVGTGVSIKDNRYADLAMTKLVKTEGA